MNETNNWKTIEEELESVVCQWENCSGGRYCEKHSLEVVDNSKQNRKILYN